MKPSQLTSCHGVAANGQVWVRHSEVVARQVYGEGGFAVGGMHLDLAAVRMGDFADDEQSQPKAAADVVVFGLCFASLKRIEESGSQPRDRWANGLTTRQPPAGGLYLDA
jgi:hypothetical protein